jgi:hypothetical protein
MIPIDLERLKLMRANGCTLIECANYFGCSVSTIQRRLNPKLVESYRKCNRRWKRNGPIDKAYPQRCKWCGIDFVVGNCRKVTCGDYCKRNYQRYRGFFVELSPRQIAEHLAHYGLTEDAAARIGMSLDELKQGNGAAAGTLAKEAALAGK